LGYPLADVIGETVKYTTGHISSIYGINEDVTQYQITVPIQSGNSGGPLFDSNGNIVGVVVSQLNKELYESENVNYAIKSNILKNIIEMNTSKSNKLKKTKSSKLSQVDKIKLFSDYVVMIQTF
jgi:S1-C subfamily serine protease